MTSKPLTPDHVHAVGLAAFENALAIMDDARILFENGRLHRAYALGVLAVEEVAKAMRCRQLLFAWTDSTSVEQLRKTLHPKHNAHERRYLDTLRYLAAYAPNVWPPQTEFPAMAKEDMRARERALYVEVANTGQPMTPAGVNAQEAYLWVSGMIGIFRTFRKAWIAVLDDALAEARQRVGVSPEVSPEEQ
jgi:AbiV family abortive infection protein